MDIAFPLPENGDVWHDVWSPTVHVQDDTVFVMGGQFAVEDAKDRPFAWCASQERGVKEPRRGVVERLAAYVPEGLLGRCSCLFR